MNKDFIQYNIDAAPAYLRKSRAEDGEDLQAVLSRHRAALEETASRLGIVITEYYEEVVSGENLYSRPEMLRLLEGIDAGTHGAVLCMDIDRLGRGGMRDQGIILDTFRAAGALIITPDKVYDLTDDDDEEMTEFKAFFARREYKMIRKRMHRGLLRTISEGGYVANAPYGYKQARIGKLPSLEIIPEEAKFVRYMFERYLEGVGAHTIADEINAMGSKPNRSSAWSRNSVRGVIKNPTYYGVVPWNRVKRSTKNGVTVAKHMPREDWMLAVGAHEPIIDQSTYDKAQAIRLSRGITSSKFEGVVRNPMAGIIVCAKCGYNMQRMGNNNGVPYILCNKTGCCAGAKAELVESALLSAMESDLEAMKLELKNSPARDADNIAAMIVGIEKEIEKAEKRRELLYDLLEDGTYSKEEFLERKKKADTELISLNERLVAAEARKAKALREDRRKLIEKLEYALKHYRAEDEAGRNRLLKSVIRSVLYTKEKKTKPSDFNIIIAYLE